MIRCEGFGELSASVGRLGRSHADSGFLSLLPFNCLGETLNLRVCSTLLGKVKLRRGQLTIIYKERLEGDERGSLRPLRATVVVAGFGTISTVYVRDERCNRKGKKKEVGGSAGRMIEKRSES